MCGTLPMLLNRVPNGPRVHRTRGAMPTRFNDFITARGLIVRAAANAVKPRAHRAARIWDTRGVAHAV